LPGIVPGPLKLLAQFIQAFVQRVRQTIFLRHQFASLQHEQIQPSAIGYSHHSVPGAVLFDDFDSVQNTAIGTITGGFIHGPAPKGPGAPVATGNFIYADGALGATLNVTVTMTEPVSYVGFAWGTSDYQQGRCV
jgi:hypothetical protein